MWPFPAEIEQSKHESKCVHNCTVNPVYNLLVVQAVIKHLIHKYIKSEIKTHNLYFKLFSMIPHIQFLHELDTGLNECCKCVLANGSRHVFAFAQKY